MESWVGANIESVFNQWGYPTEEKQITDHKLYYWQSSRLVGMPIYTIGTGAYGGGVRQFECTRMLEADEKGTVVKWQWQGNNCPFAEIGIYKTWRNRNPVSISPDYLKQPLSGIGVMARKEGAKLIIKMTLENGPAEKAGLRTGDIIKAIDSQSTSKMSLEAATESIKGPPKTKVALLIKRGDAEQTYEIERADITPKRAEPEVTTAAGSTPIKEPIVSSGTGFFISPDGYFLTNYHVIENAKALKIILKNGQSYPVTIIKADKANDIALGKADLKTLFLPLASSIKADMGEEVLTLGYPFISLTGKDQKATFGRINALNGIMDDYRFYQIDVPVQPGNSGGPLINKKGQVIGIVTQSLNSLIALKLTGALPQNVNYAIKISYAVPLVDQPMIQSGTSTSMDFTSIISRVQDTVFNLQATK